MADTKVLSSIVPNIKPLKFNGLFIAVVFFESL